MKRRELLKAGVVVGSGMLLRPGAAKAQAGDETQPLNVALIGVGLQGRALINATLLCDQVRFRAVCDIWEQSRRYGKYYLRSYQHDVNTYTDYREMLDKEEDLDAVIVASPDFVHATQTNACLEAGLHVYCETMMSHTIEGARSMVRAMRRSGKLLQIGYQRRSNPRYVHMRDKLFHEAQLTGPTSQVNAQWVFPLDDNRGWPKTRTIPNEELRRYGYGSMQQLRNWRWWKKYSGGLFGNLGSHQIDVVNWFLNTPPRSALASGNGNHDQAGRWPSNVMAISQYETPQGLVQVFYQVLTDTRGDGHVSFEHFLGSAGSLKSSQNPVWTAVYRNPDASDWDEWVRRNYLIQEGKQGADAVARDGPDVSESSEVETYLLPVKLDKPVHFPHLQNFFDAIRGQAKLTCPADEAFRTEVVALRINEAVATHKMVEFADEDFVA